MPDDVKRVAQLHHHSGGPENQREEPKYRRHRTRCGLVSGLNQTLNGLWSFLPDQILDLPYQLSLRCLLTKSKCGDSNHDD